MQSRFQGVCSGGRGYKIFQLISPPSWRWKTRDCDLRLKSQHAGRFRQGGGGGVGWLGVEISLTKQQDPVLKAKTKQIEVATDVTCPCATLAWSFYITFIMFMKFHFGIADRGTPHQGMTNLLPKLSPCFVKAGYLGQQTFLASLKCMHSTDIATCFLTCVINVFYQEKTWNVP